GGGTLMSIAPSQDILVSEMAKAGNVLLLTKECAISASAILAMSFPETATNALGKEVYDQACALFYQSSSVQDGLLAVGGTDRDKAVTAMHDVTEGGVLGRFMKWRSPPEMGRLLKMISFPLVMPSGQLETFLVLIQEVQ